MEKKHYMWIGLTVLAVLILVSWNTYSQQSKTRKAIQDQSRQMMGIQGQDTVTAKDLLSAMTKSMENQKPTINFTV